MSIVSSRTINVTLSYNAFVSCLPEIKAEFSKARPRWEIQDIVGGDNCVYLSIALHGPFWDALDAIFTAHVPGWEKMEEV